jgi:hypothetical protein
MKKWKWLRKYSQFFYKITMLFALSVFASKSEKQVAPLASRPNQNAWIYCSWGNPKWKAPRGSKLETYAQGWRGEGLKKGYKQPTCHPKKEPKRPNGAFNDEPCHDM